MKLHHIVLAAALMFGATPALAQSGFNGTWKADSASATFNEKPFEFRLKDGMYHCGACTPPLDVKADGMFHKVTGHDGFDEVSIELNPDKTITESYRKAGKMMSVGTDTLSPDGNTITYSYVDTSGANGQAVKGSVTLVRASGSAPAGLHPINGLWKTGSIAGVSDTELMLTLKVDGNTLTESFPTGESATMTFGGPAVPLKGSTSGGTVSATKSGDNEIVINRFKKDGTQSGMMALTLMPDQTLSIAMTNKTTGDTTRFKAAKQ